MIRQSRKIQFIILLTLVCLVGTMTIAYAVLSTTLNINGTAQVMDASWNVHFDNIQVNPYSVEISPTITDNDKITFSADLTIPGQFYKFTVDIVNSGSIDAMIESIIKNPELTDDQKKYLRYEVEYLDGTSINETQLLKVNETKTISVIVSYRNDIPTSNLPTTETNLDLEIRLVYVQATSIGTEIQNSESPINVVSGDLNTVGSEICIGEECFYLMSNDGYSITMLAKYNLYIGNSVADKTYVVIPLEKPTGIQSKDAIGAQFDINLETTNFPWYGTIQYSNTNYWKTTVKEYPEYTYNSNSYLYKYIEEYKEYLQSSNIIVNKARLITFEELELLGCKISTAFNCYDTSFNWMYKTTYWTGISFDDENILVVNSRGGIAPSPYDRDRSIGARPVIEIPLTEF